MKNETTPQSPAAPATLTIAHRKTRAGANKVADRYKADGYKAWVDVVYESAYRGFYAIRIESPAQAVS